MLTPDEQDRLFEELGGTMEVMGQECTPVALSMMVGDLSSYPLNETLRALARCRSEVKGRLTLASIVERIPSANAHLGPSEAWALALTCADETETVIWTEEIAVAMADARPVLQIGDKVGARMAFIASYERRVEQSKAAGANVQWSMSLGTDPAKRQTAIENALQDGRISYDQARVALPSPERADALMIEHKPTPEEIERRRQKSKAVLSEILNVLSSETRSEVIAEERRELSRREENRRIALLEQAASLSRRSG